MNVHAKSPVIFITGATGFLGSAVIAHLLESNFSCRFLLLVRGANEEACVARVIKSVGRFVGLNLLKKLSANLDIIRGDLLDQAWHDDEKLDAVTHALHLAANTSFVLELGLREINVEGALNVALAMKGRPKLRRYVHVGTAMICGTHPPQVVCEDEYPAKVTHALQYTATKAEAEVSINSIATDLPLVVVRPSIVSGHSRLGCGPSGSIFWTFRAIHALKKITWSLESKLDLITVDYAAAALAHLLLKPALAYNRYHISAGADSGICWSEINHTLAGLIGETQVECYKMVKEFSEISEGDAERAIGAGPAQRLLWVLERYYRFGKLDVVFNNHRLLAEGMPPPPKFTKHMKRCLETSLSRSIYQQMRDG